MDKTAKNKDMVISMYAIPGLKFKEPLPPVNGVPDAHQMIIKIKNCVCAYYNLELSKVHSKTRKREVVLARQMMQKLVKDNTRLSLKEIGAEINNGRPMDHTSVIHSCQTIRDLVDTDSVIRQQYNQIQTLIYS